MKDLTDFKTLKSIYVIAFSHQLVKKAPLLFKEGWTR